MFKIITPQFDKKYTPEEFFSPEFYTWLKNKMPVGKVKVEKSPRNRGTYQELWYDFKGGAFNTYGHGQDNIDGQDYSFFREEWQFSYNGNFTLINPNPYQSFKPEVYMVKDMVKVLDNARGCGSFESWDTEKIKMIGEVFEISEVIDDTYGIYYILNTPNKYTFPHYCLRRVSLKQEQETINIDGKDFTISEIKKIIQSK